MANTSPQITVTTRYFEPVHAGEPGVVVQATRLTDSFMIWAGTTEERGDQVERVVGNGRLALDFGCAMPGVGQASVSAAATSLFRSSASDVALAMSQRLARRFKKQIFLSVDIPSSYEHGPRIALLVEKRVVGLLEELLT